MPRSVCTVDNKTDHIGQSTNVLSISLVDSFGSYYLSVVPHRLA